MSTRARALDRTDAMLADHAQPELPDHYRIHFGALDFECEPTFVHRPDRPILLLPAEEAMAETPPAPPATTSPGPAPRAPPSKKPSASAVRDSLAGFVMASLPDSPSAVEVYC